MKLSAWSKRLLAGAGPQPRRTAHAGSALGHKRLRRTAARRPVQAGRRLQQRHPWLAGLQPLRGRKPEQRFLRAVPLSVPFAGRRHRLPHAGHELLCRRVETKDSTYNFTCDDQYDGGYDADLKSWFDFEFFAMDDHAEYLTEWAAAKSVTATFTGKDGSTKAYTLTKDNLQAIRDIMAAYTTLLDSDASTAQSVLSSLAK